ncbi:hypothetical protein B0T22DRAFT_476524 [Podospora appendiculata]|uniref:holo-[acyl-carrier-protein] synthase n=1 Tax=Podospora appendiculata TaxID=314037 RepID=A0AAE1CGG4_9PEZI|nr:hypothetical protein B0T22DRAFT_476524 [Podospora appendiculata]
MAATTKQVVLVQWILDTRSWFPEATQTRHLETQASRALALLPENERAAVLKYYFVRDAKMSLASALLKHYAISRLAQIPWAATTITRDARTKPVWRDPATGSSPVAFNVSHQAGIVALVAVADYPGAVEVGVDVVCTSERRERDLAILRGQQGWHGFVDMHADVFAAGEAAYLKYQVIREVPWLAAAARQSPERAADGKLRAFYALWALREAYVKLTGEALLAEWLRELEFRYFHPPRPTAAWAVPAIEETTKKKGEGEGEGDDAGDDDDAPQVIRDIEIRFRGKRVDDVNICLRSVGPDYMICTAVRTPENKADGLGWRLGPYETLSLDEVLGFAESMT